MQDEASRDRRVIELIATLARSPMRRLDVPSDRNRPLEQED
jgi:hypothetical protein